MSETQHIRGPWAAKPRRIGGFVVDGPGNSRINDTVAIVPRNYREEATVAANAHLIAAAPEMYAALKLAQGVDIHPEVLAAVDAAVRKAEGRS